MLCSLQQTDTVAVPPQSISDALASIASICADVLQTFLMLFRALLNSLGRRLSERVLQEHGRHNRLVLLQRAEQRPQRRVLVSYHAAESVIPAFANVVGSFRPVDCGPVLIPRDRGDSLPESVRASPSLQVFRSRLGEDRAFCPVVQLL